MYKRLTTKEMLDVSTTDNSQRGSVNVPLGRIGGHRGEISDILISTISPSPCVPPEYVPSLPDLTRWETRESTQKALASDFNPSRTRFGAFRRTTARFPGKCLFIRLLRLGFRKTYPVPQNDYSTGCQDLGSGSSGSLFNHVRIDPDDLC